ncbi:hypothetical protein [Actinoplanes sp. URMC 104]|uniref:hypothetical protein n=1 Tax=Actinoplanes sp. URMC 104 TaxID=3423409 RepID=UPI003F1CE9A8
MVFVVPAILAVVTLIAGSALLPAAAVAALLAACSGAVAARMVRDAVAGRAAGPRLRVLALAGGVGLTAAAGLASGIAVVAAPGATVGGVPLAAEIPLVTLFLVTGLYLAALLRPQQRRDVLARLRVGLDGLGLTACLMFACWMLLFNHREERGASITALLIGSAATATAAVAGVHALRHRAALQWCGPAAALSLVGLTALVIAQDHPGDPNAAIAGLAAGAAVDVAAAALWHGSVRISPDEGAVPPPGTEPSVNIPLLTLPILGAAVVTVYT